MKSTLSLVLAILAISSAADAKVVTIRTPAMDAKHNSFKRADGSFNFAAAIKEGELVHAKYQASNERVKARLKAGSLTIASLGIGASDSQLSKRATSIVPMTDSTDGYIDYNYYLNLGIGTPQQSLPILVDTGSADLWVPLQQTPGGPAYFVPSSSSTYSTTGNSFTLNYASGRVSGQVAKDTVTLGSFTVPNQGFGAATTVSSDFQNAPFSGIIGLGFSPIAATRQPTILQTLNQTGQLDQRMFGVYLLNGQSNGELPGSTLTIGGIDSSRVVGSFTWTPVITQAYWQVFLKNPIVNGAYANTGGFYGAIDTGTTYVYMPKTVAAAIYANVPNSQVDTTNSDSSQTFYNFPCTQSVSVSLLFLSPRYPIKIPPGEFNIGQSYSGSSTCVGGIIGFDFNDLQGRPLAIIGALFLKSQYTAFSYDHFGPGQAGVGFANINYAG